MEMIVVRNIYNALMDAVVMEIVIYLQENVLVNQVMKLVIVAKYLISSAQIDVLLMAHAILNLEDVTVKLDFMEMIVRQNLLKILLSLELTY